MDEERGQLGLSVHGVAPRTFQEGFMSCRLDGSVADQLRQLWDELSFLEPVVEEFPEGNTEFTAGLLQTGKCVSTAPTGFTSCSSAYLASFHILSYGIFAQVVMQRDCRVLGHQQKLRFVVVNSLMLSSMMRCKFEW